MENVELKLVQERELGILREILKVINKYHLRYYMLGGTATRALFPGMMISISECRVQTMKSS